jgi:hypothetical protein
MEKGSEYGAYCGLFCGLCAERSRKDGPTGGPPCIGTLGKSHPALIPDGRRLKQIGVGQRVAEQEERARRGVVYADPRCPVDGEELQEGSVDEGGECGRR